MGSFFDTTLPFLRNHQENHKKSASYQQITTKSTVNYKLLFPGGPSPHKPGADL